MRFTIFTSVTLAVIATSSVKSLPWGGSGSVSTFGDHDGGGGGGSVSTYGKHGGGGGGGGIEWDVKAKAPCNYDNKGNLRKVKDHGCPIRTRVPKGKGGRKSSGGGGDDDDEGGYGCDHKGGNNSLINLDLFNCSSLCILSQGKCPQPKNCKVKSGDNQLIGVTALDCSNVKLLSSDGP